MSTITSTIWDGTKENARIALELKDSTQKSLHAYPGQSYAYDAACKCVYDTTGRRVKAWENILTDSEEIFDPVNDPAWESSSGDTAYERYVMGDSVAVFVFKENRYIILNRKENNGTIIREFFRKNECYIRNRKLYTL